MKFFKNEKSHKDIGHLINEGSIARGKGKGHRNHDKGRGAGQGFLPPEKVFAGKPRSPCGAGVDERLGTGQGFKPRCTSKKKTLEDGWEGAVVRAGLI